MKLSFGIGCAHERRTHHTNQSGELIAWSCDGCRATGRMERDTVPSVLPSTVPHLDECDWCGDPLDPSRVGRYPKERWLFKRYCGVNCYGDDLEDRRETGRTITNPDALARGFQIGDPKPDRKRRRKGRLTV